MSTSLDTLGGAALGTFLYELRGRSLSGRGAHFLAGQMLYRGYMSCSVNSLKVVIYGSV